MQRIGLICTYLLISCSICNDINNINTIDEKYYCSLIESLLDSIKKTENMERAEIIFKIIFETFSLLLIFNKNFDIEQKGLISKVLEEEKKKYNVSSLGFELALAENLYDRLTDNKDLPNLIFWLKEYECIFEKISSNLRWSNLKYSYYFRLKELKDRIEAAALEYDQQKNENISEMISKYFEEVDFKEISKDNNEIDFEEISDYDLPF